LPKRISVSIQETSRKPENAAIREGNRMQEETHVSGPFAFFIRRWRRQVPLGLLFWRDMIVTGSVINLAAALGGLMALAMKAEFFVAMLIIHAPLPYNIFLVGSVWRTADRSEPNRAASARFGAAFWLIAATVI
jgi:hypothetical protein